MFAHIFKYRLKCLFGGRAEIFWTLIYPIVMAVFFSLAFSNLSNAGNFEPVDIAVVDNGEFRSDGNFRRVIDSVSDPGDDGRLFNMTLTTREDADERLEQNMIRGYVVFDNGPHVVLKSNGIGQTILTEFMNSYTQAGTAYMSILSRNPEAHGSLASPTHKSFVRETSDFKTGADSILVSYFALISMAAMFGSFRGKLEVENAQANLSPQGARMNLVPVGKLRIFTYSMLTTILIQLISLVLLIAFMALVLNINFGTRLLPVLVTCLFASVMGVAFGAMVASLIRGNEGVRTGILVTAGIALSAAAGMVYPDLKYVITQAAPVTAYINPANLICDSFYTLYYYGVGPRFFLNNGLLLAFSVLFTLVVYLVTRRRRYASI